MPFDAKNALDRSTVLCLACSSSLPPRASSSSTTPSYSDTKTDTGGIFTTKCCQRPICPACIKSNPRLARYDPCLACLGGVSVVGQGSSSSSRSGSPWSPNGLKSPYAGAAADKGYNLDGAVRDEDTFVVGDDDEDEDEDEKDEDGRPEYISGAGGVLFDNVHQDSAPPPPYEALDSYNAGTGGGYSKVDDEKSEDASTEVGEEPETLKPAPLPRNKSSGSDLVVSAPPPASAADEEFASTSSAPYKYYVSRGDTLQGISLRFGVNPQEICKLNKLPTSVMRTMPQLLHTRAFLLLPASARAKASPSPSASSSDSSSTSPPSSSTLKTTPITDAKVRAREARLVRERAGKKLQTLTKEVDYHLAKAYVALADDPEEQEAEVMKRKEMMGGNSSGNTYNGTSGGTAMASGSGSGSSRAQQSQLEATAIQRYLEDNEWEEEERRAGRGPRSQPLPSPSPFSFSSKGNW